MHVCRYSSNSGCSRCTAGAPASPTCAAPPRQRGSHPGHWETPRPTDTRGPQRASWSRPRLASGLSAEEGWRRGLNACLPAGSGAPMPSATSSSVHFSVAATPVGASAGDSARQLSPPPTAAPSDSGSADAGESRRATAHNERTTGSITRVREACMVALVSLANLFFALEDQGETEGTYSYRNIFCLFVCNTEQLANVNGGWFFNPSLL